MASPMATGDYNVVFVDQANAIIFETITSGVPRVGDHVDLTVARVAGVADLVTWQITDMDRTSRAFVRIRPHG